MPIMWFVKDGKRPDTQRGSGTEVSYDEIRGAFREDKPEYVSKEPPQFNIDTPSQYPVRVVIEVREEDVSDVQFPKAGFYLLPNLSPNKAQQLLVAYRDSK